MLSAKSRSVDCCWPRDRTSTRPRDFCGAAQQLPKSNYANRKPVVVVFIRAPVLALTHLFSLCGNAMLRFQQRRPAAHRRSVQLPRWLRNDAHPDLGEVCLHHVDCVVHCGRTTGTGPQRHCARANNNLLLCCRLSTCCSRARFAVRQTRSLTKSFSIFGSLLFIRDRAPNPFTSGARSAIAQHSPTCGEKVKL